MKYTSIDTIVHILKYKKDHMMLITIRHTKNENKDKAKETF